jgi:hypothetical protein
MVPGSHQVRVVRAPDFSSVSSPSVFLAGGITDCPDWQADAIEFFRDAGPAGVTLMNPRRGHFLESDPDAAALQVRWENVYLDRADVVLFWFAGGSALQPIALYELGKIGAGGKPIAVGADIAYRRRADVILQLSHARPGVEVLSTLEQTVARARDLL